MSDELIPDDFKKLNKTHDGTEEGFNARQSQLNNARIKYFYSPKAKAQIDVLDPLSLYSRLTLILCFVLEHHIPILPDTINWITKKLYPDL